MKLENLFEDSARPEVEAYFRGLSDSDKKIFEWLLIEGFKFDKSSLGRSFRSSKLSPIDWYFKTRKNIHFGSLDEYYDDFKIKDGKVSYAGDVYLYQVNKAPTPPEFKFGKVENFEITGGANLKVLPTWLPDSCDTLIFFVNHIESIKGIVKIVHSCKKLEISLPSDKLPSMRRSIKDHKPVIAGLLSVLNINDLKKISIDELDDVCDIINKFLPKGDIFDCQDALIDAGFGEYAKL